MNQPQKAKRAVNDRIAIFNIDGCISDDRWRRGRVPDVAGIAPDPKHFEHYHAGAKDDAPLVTGAAILANHISNGDFIVFASGRKMSTADETAKWIKNHFGIEGGHDFVILLRHDNDERAVVDVKKDFAHYLTKTFAPERNKTIVAAYDNRRDVVVMYRAEGIEATILNEDGEFIPQDIVEVKSEITKAPTPGVIDSRALFGPGVMAPQTETGKFLDALHSLRDQGDSMDQAMSGAENLSDEKTDAPKYPHYFKDVRHLTHIDVYRVLHLFEVTDPAIAHAVKKLLVAGGRGTKPKIKDISEAVDALQRCLDINAEDFFSHEEDVKAQARS
jgi:hypothetical protein